MSNTTADTTAEPADRRTLTSIREIPEFLRENAERAAQFDVADSRAVAAHDERAEAAT